MTPIEYNFPDFLDGDTFSETQINVKDALRNPTSLSGVTVKMIFRKGGKTGKLVKEISTNNQAEIKWLNQVNGEFLIQDFLLNWGPGMFYYDLEFTYGDGKVKTYLTGRVNIKEQVKGS